MSMSEEHEDFYISDHTSNGPKIRHLRLLKMMRQEDLGKKADLTTGTISRIETGFHPKTQLATIGKIADALDVDPHELIIWKRD